MLSPGYPALHLNWLWDPMCCEPQMSKLDRNIWPLMRSRKVFRPFHIAKESWVIEQLLSMLLYLMADDYVGGLHIAIHDITEHSA